MEPTRGEWQGPPREFGAGVVCGAQVDGVPLRSFLRYLEKPRFAWASPGMNIAGGGAAVTLSTEGPERFTTVRDRARDLFAGLETMVADGPETTAGEGRETAAGDGTKTTAGDGPETTTALPEAARPRLFGGFAFSSTHDPAPEEPWAGYPGARFVLPAVQLSMTEAGPWLTTTAVGSDAHERARSRLEQWHRRLKILPTFEPTRPPGVSALSYTPSRTHWRTLVGETVERIQEGDLEKVVLAQSLRALLEQDALPADLLMRLGDRYPDCYRFLLAPETGGTFFGATPERLVSSQNGTVETEALAGSIARGETPEADDRLARRLRKSEKNGHEHDLVTETIRSQLAALATDIHIGERTVRRLANVQHLQTPIRASLPEDTHVLDLVESLHPTPAVGGLPPEAARRTIRDTEGFNRGWYAAPVGWFDGDGNGTFAVAIRSGIATDGAVTMFAGAGIVADSDPDQEWDELQLKYRPVLEELV